MNIYRLINYNEHIVTGYKDLFITYSICIRVLIYLGICICIWVMNMSGYLYLYLSINLSGYLYLYPGMNISGYLYWYPGNEYIRIFVFASGIYNLYRYLYLYPGNEYRGVVRYKKVEFNLMNLWVELSKARRTTLLVHFGHQKRINLIQY